MQVWELVIAIISAIATIIGIVWAIIADRRGRQHLLLTHELETDTSLVSVKRDQGEDIEVKLDGQVVEDVRIYGLKFRNVGTDPITFNVKNTGSFDQSFGIRFRNSAIIRAGIADSSPGIITDATTIKDHILLDASKNLITFTNITLNAEEWIKLKVLTHGKAKYTVEGHLTGARGNGIRESVPPRRFIPNWMLASISVAVGVLVTLVSVLSVPIARGDCAFGSLDITGSSAFANEVTEYAQQYHGNCALASITIHPSSTLLGLSDLESGKYQIADADFSAASFSRFSDLQDHQVGVIVFVLVANKSVKVTNLTHSQLVSIFTGKITNWKDITGQPQPIIIINRTNDSGTYRALKNYVLGGVDPLNVPGSIPVSRSDLVVPQVAQTPGALGYVEAGIAAQPSNVSQVTMLAIDGISSAPGQVENNTYPFWSIEHMYTKGEPGPLARSFIRYVQDHSETTDSLVRLGAMSQGALQMRGT
jgi:phosphate transport system substrate-binding protein